MKKKPILVVMLTYNDMTVENAYEIFDQCRDSKAEYWGFKEEPLPLDEMKKLYAYMKECGKKTSLEVVAYTEKECIEGAKMAVKCGCDMLMGTIYFDSVNKICKENGLEYITVSPNLDSQFYQFPEDKVGNRQKLSEHIQKLFNNPVKVVTVEVNRKINKGKKMDGTTFSLDIGEAREHALHTYTPEGARKECFCQMCKKVKPYSLMEVNNIEIKPKYFFPEMRLALCLECSKRFEFLRGNTANRMDFIDRIKRTVIAFQKNIAIPLGKNYTITFTGKHLAEIQEILKRIDK